MDAKRKAALEAEGWVFGSAADFLGMSAAERQEHETRLALALEVRRRRRLHNLTQGELARRMKSSQPRVAKIEAAAPDVSLELMFKAVGALGGRCVVHVEDAAEERPRTRTRPRPAKKTRTRSP